MISTPIKFASYNMHGFNSGLPMMQDICNSVDIILIQEHWLHTSELNKLNLVHDSFSSFAVSAMDKKSGNGILHGRPFGGTGILWRKSLVKDGLHIKLIDKDEDDGRYITVMLSNKLLITCVYLPCHSNSIAYNVELSAICAHLESLLDKYTDCYHIIAGDFNFECNSAQQGYKLFNNLCSTYNIKCMDNESDACGYTYCSEALGHQTWIDHVFVSESLCHDFTDFKIVDSGCNNSDHNPITWHIEWYTDVPIRSNLTKQQQHCMPRLHWDKADVVHYYSLTGQMLQSINVPTHVFYEKVNCESSIECFYSSIVKALVTAGAACVPTIPQNALKPFWNADLDELKRQSVDVHELWKSMGKPRMGPINTARLKIKAEYKCAIRRAAVEFENSHLDESAEYFAHRDMNNFWRAWNIKYNKRVRVEDVCIDGNTSANKIADSFRQFYASIYVNSADDKCKVDEFNKHRLLYVGDANDISVTVEDIEQAVSKLSVKKQLELMVLHLNTSCTVIHV